MCHSTGAHVPALQRTWWSGRPGPSFRAVTSESRKCRRGPSIDGNVASHGTDFSEEEHVEYDEKSKLPSNITKHSERLTQNRTTCRSIWSLPLKAAAEKLGRESGLAFIRHSSRTPTPGAGQTPALGILRLSIKEMANPDLGQAKLEVAPQTRVASPQLRLVWGYA